MDNLEFIFFFSLSHLIAYTFAAVSPFIDNIEGFVYFKNKYLQKKAFLKFQLEMIIYSILFASFLSAAYLLF
jgi:surface polysaccharide O-acyltransferase-like enzyme